jgi:hypothetical protein
MRLRPARRREIVLEEFSGFMRVRYLAMEHSNGGKKTK